MGLLRLKATVTKDHQLIVTLPDHIPPGEVEIMIEVSTDDSVEALIEQYKHPEPKTGAEIAAMLQEMEPGYTHIEDSEAWVENLRRSTREDRKW